MTREIDGKILSVIKRALDQFGANISRVAFYKFKTETGLDPQSAIHPKNLDQFVKCLSAMFGMGYKIVEIRLARELIREFVITAPSFEKGSSNEEKNAVNYYDLVQLISEIRSNAVRNELVR